MRKRPHRTGSGDHAIDEFVEGVVNANNGSVTKEATGLRISFPDEKPSLIAYAPKHQGDWESRLKWVEKQAAVYLLHAPILYGIQWEAKSRKAPVRVLRLSLGLSLSMGQPHPKRYTCILKVGKAQAKVAEGGHLPEVTGGTRWLLTGLPVWAQNELQKFPPAVLRACDLFRNGNEVQVAFSNLGKQFSDELSYLDGLYRRKQGTNDKLYGLPTPGTEGSASIEAELRRLQNTVLERYRLKLRLRILSLGVFEGDVPDCLLG